MKRLLLRPWAWLALLLVAGMASFMYGVFVRRDVLHLAREAYWHARRGWARVNGQLVDVGGYRLYISCRGSGSPAVVMDAGLESSGNTWRTVVPDIARFTRVCYYDRHGVGLSDGLPSNVSKRTASDVVAELRILLAQYGVSPPYVLVGHSMGGFHVRLYAARNPDQTAGVVLVDATHEDQHAQYVRSMSDEERGPYLRKHRGGNFERLDILESARQVRESQLPAVPLVVLSAGTGGPLQDDLARLLPGARHILVPHSGHHIQTDAPAVLVDALRGLVAWSGAPDARQAVKR